MSFSSEIKDELCRISNEKSCCKRAELAGILRTGLILRKIKGETALLFITEHASVSRLIYSNVKELLSNRVNIFGEKTNRLKKHIVYRIDFQRILGNKESCNFFKSIGIEINSPENKLEYSVFGTTDRCCIRSYLRGGFLAVGSVTSPDKSYHLEMSFTSKRIAEEYMNYMEYFNLKPKHITRKNYEIVYMKEAQDIVDFLNVINAHQALLEMENIRILKEMRNQVNRLVNCETANLGKTVNASLKQIECIKYLDQTIGIENLSVNLKEIARLRIENPEASLSELGKMLHPELGKSGVNHRLRKLEKMATEIIRKDFSGK